MQAHAVKRVEASALKGFTFDHAQVQQQEVNGSEVETSHNTCGQWHGAVPSVPPCSADHTREAVTETTPKPYSQADLIFALGGNCPSFATGFNYSALATDSIHKSLYSK